MARGADAFIFKGLVRKEILPILGQLCTLRQFVKLPQTEHCST
jgi:hypothetical protein